MTWHCTRHLAQENEQRQTWPLLLQSWLPHRTEKLSLNKDLGEQALHWKQVRFGLPTVSLLLVISSAKSDSTICAAVMIYTSYIRSDTCLELYMLWSICILDLSSWLSFWDAKNWPILFILWITNISPRLKIWPLFFFFLSLSILILSVPTFCCATSHLSTLSLLVLLWITETDT